MRENGRDETAEEEEKKQDVMERKSVKRDGDEEMNEVIVLPPVMEIVVGKENVIRVKEMESVFRMMDVFVEDALTLEFTFTDDPGDEERFDTTEIPLKSIDSNTPIDSFTTIVGDDEYGMR
jgi:hypothetical protein